MPTLTEEGLKIWREKRDRVSIEKKEAYKKVYNGYLSGKSLPFEPTDESRSDVRNSLYDIFSGNDVDRIATEHKEYRQKADYELAKTMIEKVIPFYLSKDEMIGYILEAAFRDMSKIDSKKGPRGRKDGHKPIAVFSLEDWKENFEKYVFFDNRAYTDEINQYMPDDMNPLTTRPMSTRHIFIPAELRQRKKNGKNGRNSFPDYSIIEPEIIFYWRTKSGQQFAYKLVEYISSMRKSITDFVGAQIAYKKDYEDNSINLFQKVIGNNKGFCDNLLVLQSLDPKIHDQMENFLDNLSRARNMVEKILTGEDRSKKMRIDPSELRNLLKKHYLEMRLPFSCVSDNSGNGFGRNVMEIQTYHIPTLSKIDEKYNHSLYEGRKEDERESWTYFDWVLLDIVNEKFLEGFSKEYIKQILPRWIGSKDRLFISK
jgi:hypothetical protein